MSESTISFYRVSCDLERYQFLMLDTPERDLAGHLRELERVIAGEPDPSVVFDGRPWADVWQAPPVYSFKPRLRSGAFWGVWIPGASFAVHPDALARGHLSVFLNRAGELLPLEYDGREFSILNVTECVDALDRERTIYDTEPEPFDEFELAGLDEETVQRLRERAYIPQVDEPRFRLDRLGWQLFKVPETAITDLYYWERSEDGPDEQFRRYCEREALDGLTFELIYTTDEI